MKNFLHKTQYSIVCAIVLLFGLNMEAQIGDLIWEDDFNSFNTSVWNPITGNGCEIGLCGWGNVELEYYSENNISIESVPGETGNSALVLEAKRETIGTNEFTSGKVDSDGNLSVHYGLIEIRMRAPSVETGLWPAAWLLGTANLSWPSKGEIDMMEMGHRSEEITNQGHPGTNQNNYVGANAIFANEDGSVGSIAYDVNYNKPHVSSTSLADRFVTYRLYWEPTEMRFTVIDNGTEYDLYEGPLPLNPDSVTGVFNKPFYFLMNLAVGGNFTDAATPNEVTAPLPSKLYIDYVRVYEWNGHGSVEFDYGQLEPEVGPFGVYTENTPTNNELSFGLDAEIYVWGGTMQDGNTTAFEGNEVIAWETTTTNSWFGGGITSTFGRDMSGYVEEGNLKFNIKIPADVSFRIGVTDNFTNESWITFNANETQYGLTRNGEWGQVEIPLVDFAGLIAFQNINYMFAIASVDGAFPSSTFQFGIDNIVWDDGNEIITTIPVTGVSSSPASVSLEIGQTTQLSATVTPNNASNQEVAWNSSNTSVATVNSSGLVTAQAAGNATITVTTVDGALTDTTTITVNQEATQGFIPDPNKTYYIDSPIHNLRIAASGSSETPYTTSTNTTGDDVEWKFVDRGNGYWQIERVAGGTKPRLRSNNTVNADMQPTSSNGGWTYYEFEEGYNEGTYFMTLPNGPTNHKRLQVNNSGVVRMVSTASNRTWESFTFIEVNNTPTSTDLFIEAEDFSNMSGIQVENCEDVNGGENVGYIDTGDWLEYIINIPTSGSYSVNSRLASAPGNAAFQFQVNGAVLGTTNIPNTGGWQSWTTITTNINLSAGIQTLRLYSVGDNFNINWLEIESATSSAKSTAASTNLISNITLYPVPVQDMLNISIPDFEDHSHTEVVDMNGSIVADSIIESQVTTISVDHLNSGLYLARIYKNGILSQVLKFVK